MDWVFNLGLYGTSLINGITNNIHDSSESFRTDWDTDWSSSVNNILTSDKTFSGIHGNSSDSRVSQMLGNFEY